MRTPNPTELSVLAVLRAAQEADCAPLLRTVLHKLIYLVDVYVAEETGGKTYTGEEWRFLHFGPFANAVATAVDNLIADRVLSLELKSSGDDAKEFGLIRLARADAHSLREIGVPGSAALRIGADLKAFSRDLPALLDKVYFRTSPMEFAKPRDVLKFDGCRKADVANFRPVAMLPIPAGKLARARARLAESAKLRVKPAPVAGAYDAIYASAIAELDGQNLETGLSGHALISSE